MIGRDEIAAMIPHAGRMCLLDEVVSWDSAQIRCSTRSHRDADHPLARGSRLPVLAGLEYAAQAMAVHGRLSGAPERVPKSGDRFSDETRAETIKLERPRAGFIASVRDLVWSVEYLDDVEDPLLIEAEKRAGDGTTALYAFRLSAASRDLLQGRAAVLLAEKAA